MSEHTARFGEYFTRGLVYQQPTELLKLFHAKTMKEVMEVAATATTDLETLLAETPNYMDEVLKSEYLEFAKKQKTLPLECAFALRAYTRSEIFHPLNNRIREGKDLQAFQQLCICIIKGLALLPAYTGKTFRCIGKGQDVWQNVTNPVH